MNADVFEAVCAMGDAARTAQSQLAQANTEAKNQLLNAIADAHKIIKTDNITKNLFLFFIFTP